MLLYADICIYLCMSDSTYTNTLTYKCTQTQAHIHTNKIPFQHQQHQKINHINHFFKPSTLSYECIKHENPASQI